MSRPPRPLVVIDVVGLTPAHLEPGHLGPGAPNLARLADDGFSAPLGAVLPAVTCSAQATMLTGLPPRGHGIVGNGWYFRDLAEVWFWRQSNRLVEGEKIWERLRRRHPGLTCAQLFWWYNMGSTVDQAVTPRPIYPADGRKIPGLYSQPPELEAELQKSLGPFPFFDFWGPRAGIASSRWIASAAIEVQGKLRPDLSLVYLPHLDYDLQRFGPDGPEAARALAEVDREAGRVIDAARERGAEVLVVSEYGIGAVRGSVSLNRVLRREGLLRVQRTLTWELLDPGASRAFAVADHQVAHVYVREAQDVPAVKRLLEGIEGVDRVLDRADQAAAGLDHPRSGELVAVAKGDRWFDYYYWLDDARAPDFAPTVDIHRKPGYDPCELFLDPKKRWVKGRILLRLVQKKLGLRYLMDVIPLDPSLVRGSHGRLPEDPARGPVIISSSRRVRSEKIAMAEVPKIIEELVSG